MGIPSADFLHAGPSAAQPASERLQNRLPILRFGVFLTTVGGAAGLIVAEIAEGMAILRGIKRSMQARQMWVEAEEQQNPCSQQ